MNNLEQRKVNQIVQLRNLLFIVGSLVCTQVNARDVLIVAKLGAWSFDTENVRGRPETSSGFGAYSVEIGYSFSRHFLGVIGANLLMSDGVSGSTGSGFDVGFRYYPLTDATQAETQTEDTYVRINERWRPYAGLFLRQRDFNLALQSGYVGPGTSLGLDYNFNKNWHINAEFRYDMLYGSGEGTAQQMNVLFGIGVEL